MQIKESWIKKRSEELVDDLNAVRATILSKEKLSAVEHARLEPRLFESWVIEKLALHEGLAFSFTDLIGELEEEVKDLREEMKALRKSLPRAGKGRK